MTEFVFEQIGVIRSPYKEKFAVPRQPGLVEDGGGELLLLPPYNRAEAVRGLSDFSHLWVMFIFHQTTEGGWRPTVRPPRLGGNARMGVFATRSTFRPNPLGMSLIELKGVRIKTATWCWSWAASIWSTAPRWWTSSLICRSPRASRRPAPALPSRARRRYAGAFRAAGRAAAAATSGALPAIKAFYQPCWRKTPSRLS